MFVLVIIPKNRYPTSILLILIILYFTWYSMEILDIIFIILWWVLVLWGLVWCILPILPWPNLVYIWLLLLQATSYRPFSVEFLVLWWVVNIAMIWLDYVIPLRWTKKMWGSSWWKRWSFLWVIVWFFFGIPGIILWPFAWAFLGEILYTNNSKKAWNAAWGAFLWLMVWVVFKVIVAGIMAVYFFKAVILLF